jgi:hypothetical protein
MLMMVANTLPVEIAMQTLSIPAAGRKYYGLGRSASYEAADRGDIPTIRVGKKLRRVPKRAMEALMHAASEEALRRARIRGAQLVGSPATTSTPAAEQAAPTP